jgi:hypothetical protein
MKLGPSRGWTLLEPWPPLGPGMATGSSGAFDAKTLEQRISTWQQVTRPVVLPAHALFVALLVLVPLATALDAWPRAWPIILAAVLVPWLIVLVTSLNACRRIHPQGGRWSRLMPLVLSPIAAVRARDVLARDVCRDFHPVAVARVLCARGPFIKLARWYYYDPDLERGPLTSFLSKHGALTDVLAAPPPEDDRTVSYCPRCLSQYHAAVDRCAECGSNTGYFPNHSWGPA